ncbi:efflux RND transporter periplasmic adaptor subunit [Hyphobacterium sp. HN65]|uniref:Efflux RND transporter periplasmic adaptor subunit n=1 Tax=Hyphobacterium lacteum TaxID=3116575 RepID=A0ABU7LT58_9PROT|nr:efflux RND transporter periplasmic adaptor subunit [Hyphobacterium sp. HN65]MEE2527111.1 efflux RND transporter periplasmic adaptor subunit [Hyphobacterium sp. HN65]
MQLNGRYFAALVITLIVSAFFLFGSLFNQRDNTRSEQDGQAPSRAPRVIYEIYEAGEQPALLVLRGRTEAIREVAVRAETGGRVVEAPAIEGAYVEEGDLLCRLDVDARQAALDQANADLRAAQQEYEGAVALGDRGYRSQNSIAALEAARDGARARLEAARQELDNIYIRAPFSGWFDRRAAEVGDFLARGEPCGVVLELDPVLAAAQVAERDIESLEVGMQGRARLVTGEIVEGTIRRIARQADQATRTFRTELAIANPDGELRAGVTAEIIIPLAARPAHRVPTTVLALNDDGNIGVRIIGEDNRVRFVEVEWLSDDAEGSWVSGLPDPAQVIIQGQDFVEDGAVVDAVRAE